MSDKRMDKSFLLRVPLPLALSTTIIRNVLQKTK